MSGAKLLSELVARDIMTRDVLSVQPEWPIEQLADFLVRRAISGAPVVSETGELVGVVSLTDVARASTLSEEDLGEADRHEFYSRLLDEPFSSDDLEIVADGEHSQIKVQEIMTPIVIEVPEDTPIPKVAATMVDSRVHRLFVTRDGRMAGIVTALDVMKVIADSV